MNTQVSFDELIGVFAPLWDATQMVNSMSRTNFVAELESKLESAKAPLMEHIKKIEKENPDQFTLD